jgi:hypothetical protein
VGVVEYLAQKTFALREEIPEDTPHVINLGEVNSTVARSKTQ